MTLEPEQRAAGDLAMLLRAEGDHESAAAWAKSSARDRQLPAPGVDGSHNFAPCFLAGAAEWDRLGEVLDDYWSRGAGNEFNSPLYGARVLTAAALRALLSPSPEAEAFVRRWVEFLSLQAILVHDQPRRIPVSWGGRRVDVGFLIRGGVAVPPTGCRMNGGAIEPYWCQVLAVILKIAQRFHHVPEHWINWRPPRTREAWGHPHAAMPNPWGLARTIELAEAQAGRHFYDSEWTARCRRAIGGNLGHWQELADGLGDVPLPRGFERFGIQRRPDSVTTWWEGISPTRQKPSVAAARAGAKPAVLLVAAQEPLVPATKTLSRRVGSAIEAEADVKGQLMLGGPAPDLRSVTLFRGR